MQRLALATFVAILALAPRLADAGGPTPTPTEATQQTIDITFSVEDSAVTVNWSTVAGAAEYRLTGSVQLIRVNAADPFCEPPAVSESPAVAIDETLPGSTTEFTPTLPPFPDVPPQDDWFVSGANAQVEAVDGAGNVLGSGLAGFVADPPPCPPTPTPTFPAPTATVEPSRLPATGDGSDTHQSAVFPWSVVSAGSVVLALLAGMSMRRRAGNG